jgi:hypothetical protein
MPFCKPALHTIQRNASAYRSAYRLMVAIGDLFRDGRPSLPEDHGMIVQDRGDREDRDDRQDREDRLDPARRCIWEDPAFPGREPKEENNKNAYAEFGFERSSQA